MSDWKILSGNKPELVRAARQYFPSTRVVIKKIIIAEMRHLKELDISRKNLEN